jgi:chemotaxis protein MotB
MQTPAPLEPRAPQIDPHRLQAFLVAAKERVARLEKTIEEQSQTLSSCHAQILELSNTRDRQADELEAARETIRAQEQSLAAERETAAKREAELTAAARKREAELTAAAQKRDAELTAAVQKRDAELADTVQKCDAALSATVEKLDVCDRERLALQAGLKAAQHETAEVSARLLAAETALNDQSAAAAAAQETIDRSNAELEQLRTQNAALETELDSERRQRRDLDGLAAVLRSEIASLTESRQQIVRQAEILAMDRCVLQERCEELLRAIRVLQAARRKMGSELQVDAGDLGHLHAVLAEMKASHDLVTSRFEQAETKLTKMRQHIETLGEAHAILAKYDAALVEPAASGGGDPEQARQRLKSKNKLFELLEGFFQDRRDSNHDAASGGEVPPASGPVEAAGGPPPAREEQGADIIELQTAARGKRVA